MSNYEVFPKFSLAVLTLFTKIEISWSLSSIKDLSFDGGFIRSALIIISNPHALRVQQNMKMREYTIFIFTSIFWGAKRHHYSMFDVGRSFSYKPYSCFPQLLERYFHLMYKIRPGFRALCFTIIRRW